MRNNLLEETRKIKPLPQQGNNKNWPFQDTMNIATMEQWTLSALSHVCVRVRNNNNLSHVCAK